MFKIVQPVTLYNIVQLDIFKQNRPQVDNTWARAFSYIRHTYFTHFCPFLPHFTPLQDFFAPFLAPFCPLFWLLCPFFFAQLCLFCAPCPPLLGCLPLLSLTSPFIECFLPFLGLFWPFHRHFGRFLCLSHCPSMPRIGVAKRSMVSPAMPGGSHGGTGAWLLCGRPARLSYFETPGPHACLLQGANGALKQARACLIFLFTVH